MHISVTLMECFPHIYHSLNRLLCWSLTKQPPSLSSECKLMHILCNKQKIFSHSCCGYVSSKVEKFRLLEVYITSKVWKLTKNTFHYFAFTCHLQFFSIMCMLSIVHTKMEKNSIKTVNSEVTVPTDTSVSSLFWYQYFLQPEINIITR
jgi:hypothetical protein